MTPALIDYLISFKDTKMTIASNILEDAKKLASKYPEYLTSTYLDISNVRFTILFALLSFNTGTRPRENNFSS